MRQAATAPFATTLQRLGLATVIVNVVIVLTGGAVRLTGSGLGCPDWPTCNEGSVVPVPGAETAPLHQAVEFGNRLLSVVVLIVVLAALVTALRRRPRRADLLQPAWLLLAGVLAQGVVGGVTVLTGLNPLIVATHFLLSMVLIAAAMVFNHRARRPTGATRVAVRTPLRHAEGVLLAVLAVVLTLGTLVTASGPHAGDPGTPRLGIDPELISQFHADGVFLLLGLTIALWFALRATDAPPAARRATTILLIAALSQGTIGYVQYFTGLPEILVGAHMLGACLVWIAALNLWLQSTVTVDGLERTASSGAREVAAT
jgi:cytochrome c oxidase assembly protein subunit 15